jgi:hypothetical protein
MAEAVGNCSVGHGVSVKRLRHFRCRACGAKFYDDDAVHRIQSERAKHSLARAG